MKKDAAEYDISFVVLTWNSEAYIKSCIIAIDKIFIKKRGYVCIVDNGSTDKTRTILSEMQTICKNIMLDIILLDENKGTTVSRNLGIKKVIKSAPYLCILDSDTQINEQAITEMIQVLLEYPQVGIIGPKLCGLDGSVQNSGRMIPTLTIKLLKILPVKKWRMLGAKMEEIHKTAGLIKAGYLMSACWLMRSSLVNKIGLLDERIFYAPEDVEYCLRVWQCGYEILYDRQVSIIHAWQRLSRKKFFSKHNWEHIKGLIYLFWKYKYCFKAPDYVKCD